MIALFDTSIYIDLFAGMLSAPRLESLFGHYIIRVSPIVLHELYRGVRTKKDQRPIDRLAGHLLRIEPPSWARTWILAGHLLPRLFPDYESVGLAHRLQNDVLLALTARGQGALLVTRDPHFRHIRGLISFQLSII